MANIHIWSHLAQFLLEWEMFQRKFLEEIKTYYILCSATFFFFENRAIYEKMWKNIVEPGKAQMIIWCTHFACCMPKATNTHSQYVTLIAFPLQQWSHKRASLLRYTYTACLAMNKDVLCEVRTAAEISLGHRTQTSRSNWQHCVILN